MNKVYFLGTCSTCKRMMSQLDLERFEKQDIKTEPIAPAQLDKMKDLAGSYEALFSRRAMKYKSMKLSDKDLNEKDYRQLILDEYTFLKRPVFIIGSDIFVGSSQKNIDSLQKRLDE